MNISDWYGEIISATLALVGVMLGWRLSYRSSKRLAQDHAKREAGRRCRSEFSSLQQVMHSTQKRAVAPQDEGDIRRDALESEMPRLHRAVIEFLPYLSDSEQAKMLNAWKNYSECDQTWPEGGTSVSQFIITNSNDPSGFTPLDHFDHRINAILRFTVDKRDKTIRDRLCYFCKK